MSNSKFEFKVEFGLEIQIRPNSMVELCHKVIEFGQEIDFLALKIKKKLFAKKRLAFAQNMNTSTFNFFFVFRQKLTKMIEFESKNRNSNKFERA